jgi:hypothetical protein
LFNREEEEEEEEGGRRINRKKREAIISQIIQNSTKINEKNNSNLKIIKSFEGNIKLGGRNIEFKASKWELNTDLGKYENNSENDDLVKNELDNENDLVRNLIK